MQACRKKSQLKNGQYILCEVAAFQIFGNNPNQSKFKSWEEWDWSVRLLAVIWYRAFVSFSFLSKHVTRCTELWFFFLFVLYGRNTWSVTLMEGHGLRVFANVLLRKVLGPKQGKVTGEWKRQHQEELCNLHCSPSCIRVVKSRRIRRAGNVAVIAYRRSAFTVLKGGPERKRPFQSSRWD
jgi:hypothetical protein